MVTLDSCNSRGNLIEHFRSVGGLKESLSDLLKEVMQHWKGNEASYGLAVQLRPFVGKGCTDLDGAFGKALKNGSKIGSYLYYEGLYWMQRSGNLSVKVAEDGNVKKLMMGYIKEVDRSSLCYKHGDFYYVGTSVVLVSSKEKWDLFVNEKISNSKISSEESYLFDRQIINKVQDVIKKNGIESSYTSLTASLHVRKDGDVFSLYSNGYENKIGQISIVHKKVSPSRVKILGVKFGLKEEIFVEDLRGDLKLVFAFIRDVITRSGSFYSVHAWIKQLNKKVKSLNCV